MFIQITPNVVILIFSLVYRVVHIFHVRFIWCMLHCLLSLIDNVFSSFNNIFNLLEFKSRPNGVNYALLLTCNRNFNEYSNELLLEKK